MENKKKMHFISMGLVRALPSPRSPTRYSIFRSLLFCCVTPTVVVLQTKYVQVANDIDNNRRRRWREFCSNKLSFFNKAVQNWAIPHSSASRHSHSHIIYTREVNQLAFFFCKIMSLQMCRFFFSIFHHNQIYSSCINLNANQACYLSQVIINTIYIAIFFPLYAYSMSIERVDAITMLIN